MLCCKRFMFFLTPFLVLGVIALAGCGGGKKPKIKEEEDDTPAAKGGSGGGEGAGASGGGDYAISGYGGSLKGRVTFSGSPDEGKFATKVPDKNQAECPKAIPEEGWYTQDSSDKKGVRFAVVFVRPVGSNWKEKDIDKAVLALRGGTKDKPGPEFVEVEQPHCQFEPRVSLVYPDQKLRGKNNSSPPISHDFNLKDFRGNPAFSSTVSPGSIQVVNLEPNDRAPYVVGCNQHTSFMNGYVWKFKHPFAAITDKNGDFVINTVPNLSKGKLELVVWHEMLKTDRSMKVVGEVAGTKDEQKSITVP